MDASQVKMISEGMLRERRFDGILPHDQAVAMQCEQSPIEYLMYHWLRRAGVQEIQKQKKVGKYYLDLFIPSESLNIECDGEGFHQDKEKDRKRDLYLIGQGIRVLRFTGSEIMNDAFGCVKVAGEYLPEIQDSFFWKMLTEPQPEYVEGEENF